MPAGTVWTTDEDEELKRLVDKLGEKKWAQISGIVKTKTSKQCRRRWLNHLNMQDSKKGSWSPEEDKQLLELHKHCGNKWTEIARKIGGRTDNAVKNRFHAISRRDDKSKGMSSEDGGPSEDGQDSAATSPDMSDTHQSSSQSSRDLLKNCSLERVRKELEQRQQHAKWEEARLNAVNSCDDEEMKVENPPNVTVLIPQDSMSCPQPVGQIFVPQVREGGSIRHGHEQEHEDEEGPKNKQDMLSPAEKKYAEEVNDMDEVPVHISFIGSDKGEAPEIMDYTALPQGSFISNGEIPLCVFPSAESLLEALKSSCTPPGSFTLEPIEPPASENGRHQLPPLSAVPSDCWVGALTEEHKKLLTRLFLEGKKGSIDNREAQVGSAPVTSPEEQQASKEEHRCLPKGQAVTLDRKETTSSLADIMPESPFVSHVAGPPMPAAPAISSWASIPASTSGVHLSPIFSQVNLESLLSVISSVPSAELMDFINTSGIRMVDASQLGLVATNDPMDED
eukprot:evm.model.scf_422.11 EVM.evm.TU.scf_422.11   scf_422:85626-88857(-)